MADDQVSIELLAKVDGLTSGLTEAVNAMREAVDAIKEDTHELEETAKETESTLKEMLSGENFLLLKEKAEMALEGVKKAFEDTIGAAEEFGLSNAKFAAMMGTSTTQAAGLSAALHGVGSSSEEYESMALRLQQRLNTNEAAMEQLGIKTRDASGNLLSGKDLMDSAISTMQTYKSGTDQNAFATEVFGRRAADVYSIMRVGDEQVQHQIDIYQQMGVQLEGTGEQSEKVEEALNDLHTVFQAVGIAVGQQLTPFLLQATKGMQDFQAVGEVVSAVVKGLITAVEGLWLGFKDLGVILYGVGAEFVDVFKGVGAVMYDVLHGNFSAIGDDARAAFKEMSDDFSTSIETMQSQASGFLDNMKSLWGGAETEEKSDKNPFKPEGGGQRRFVAPKKGGGSPDAEAEEGIKTEEKLALARVATEESTNAHLLAMGRETADAFVEQQRQLEDAKGVIQQRAFEKELQLPNLTEAVRQKVLDEMRLAQQSHEDALTKIAQEGESKRAEAAKAALSEYLKADDERLKAGIATYQEEAAAGKISIDQRDQAEIALTQTVRREELARLDAMLATLTPGTAAYEEMLRKREQLERQFTQQLKTENETRRKDLEASVSQWVTPIAGGFKTAMNDMLLHGKNFTDAMNGLFHGLADGFVNMVENMGEKWIEQQITNALIATTTSQTAAVAQMSANTGVAATGAAASQAAIPIVGPGLAIAAAAAMVAALAGYEALAHAEGGMVVDRDRLVFAHKEEMILPANLSKGMQQMIGQGGAQSVGDTYNLYHSPQVAAPPEPSLDRMLRSQGDALISYLIQAKRDGKFR